MVGSLTNGAEAYKLTREIGAGIKPVKAAIWHSYRLLVAQVPAITLSRVKDFWYGDSRVCVRADEIDALRRVAAEMTRRKQEAKNVLRGLAGTYRGAAERLRAIDPVRYQSEITRLEREAGEMGGDTQSGVEGSVIRNGTRFGALTPLGSGEEGDSTALPSRPSPQPIDGSDV